MRLRKRLSWGLCLVALAFATPAYSQMEEKCWDFYNVSITQNTQTGEIISETREFLFSWCSSSPTPSDTSVDGGGSPDPDPQPDPDHQTYWVRYRDNESRELSRRLAAMEVKGGAKVDFEQASTSGWKVSYEISLEFAKWGAKLAGEYESSKTIKVVWSKTMPNDGATYNIVADEVYIRDYYDIMRTTILGGTSVIASKQPAEKHSKTRVDEYRNGVKL